MIDSKTQMDVLRQQEPHMSIDGSLRHLQFRVVGHLGKNCFNGGRIFLFELKTDR